MCLVFFYSNLSLTFDYKHILNKPIFNSRDGHIPFCNGYTLEMANILIMASGKSAFEISTGIHVLTVSFFYIQTFCIAEFFAYIFLFYHLYIHNENMTTFNKQDLNINQEISRKAINKRHQKNIISLAGQFGAFLIEIFLLIIIIIFQSKSIENFVKQYLGLKMVDLSFIIVHASKAIITMTFISASPELRRYFKEKIVNF